MILILLIVIIFELGLIAYLLTIETEKKSDTRSRVDRTIRSITPYPKNTKRKPVVNDDLKSYKEEHDL